MGPTDQNYVSSVSVQHIMRLKYVIQFKSLGGEGGHLSPPPPIIMEGSRATRPKVLLPEVLCKNSVILKQFSQFKSVGVPQGGEGGGGVPEPPLPPRGYHSRFKTHKAKSFGI